MKNPLELTGKRILVTGASSGIGRSVAVCLSELGADIVAVARRKEQLEETVSQCAKGNHITICIDFNDIPTIGEAMKTICTGKPLDGIVHCAGIRIAKPVAQTSYSDIEKSIAVNVAAFIELLKWFAKRSYNNGGGAAVAISSASAHRGCKGLTAYSASKSALEASVRCIAMELVAKNIRVNAVAPGWVETPMYNHYADVVGKDELKKALEVEQPMGVIQPVDIANAVAFLLSDASRFITGTTLPIDGGYLIR